MLSYRQIPTFGRDTIRRFATNSSEMKKMAARDFEDLLQVLLSPSILANMKHLTTQLVRHSSL